MMFDQGTDWPWQDSMTSSMRRGKQGIQSEARTNFRLGRLRHYVGRHETQTWADGQTPCTT